MYPFFQTIKLMRLYQWNKNFFVFTGVIFAHLLDNSLILHKATLTFLAFSLISSAVYIFNDYTDRESDKLHPTKKYRPLAAGTLSVHFAFWLMACLLILSLTLAYIVSITVFYFLLIYFINNLAYSMVFKHIVVLDVIFVASGFLLRLLAGTIGLGIKPSVWLILCGTTVALFLALGKRKAELNSLDKPHSSTEIENQSGVHRKVLKQYSSGLLDFLILIAAASTIITYLLYTIDPVTVALHQTDMLIYTLPFVIYGIGRYLVRIYRDSFGGDPSHDLFTDPHIILTVVAWIMVTINLIRI